MFNQLENLEIVDIPNQEIKQIMRKFIKCPLWISRSSELRVSNSKVPSSDLMNIIFLFNPNFPFRTNPLPKPPREYSMLPPSEQELAEYGPASYVPGDRLVHE